MSLNQRIIITLILNAGLKFFLPKESIDINHRYSYIQNRHWRTKGIIDKDNLSDNSGGRKKQVVEHVYLFGDNHAGGKKEGCSIFKGIY